MEEAEEEASRMDLAYPNSFRDLTDQHYPVIITYMKLLDMLNNTFPDPFVKGRQRHNTKTAKSIEISTS